jgi:hypothetical protein
MNNKTIKLILIALLCSNLYCADIKIGESESQLPKEQLEGKIVVGSKSIYKYKMLIVNVKDGKVISVEKRNIGAELKQKQDINKQASVENEIAKKRAAEIEKENQDAQNVDQSIVQDNNESLSNNSDLSSFHVESSGKVTGFGPSNEVAFANATKQFPKNAVQNGEAIYTISYRDSIRTVKCEVYYRVKN